MKVFLSSVIAGMEELREVVGAAVRSLGDELVRAEDFGASPQSSQQACLAAVRDADVVILLLGSRYGQIQDTGVSATHEEYREAKQRCDVLVFIQGDVELEPEQKEFVREVQDWSAGQYTEPFQTPEELRDLLIHRLHELELARQAGKPDEAEMLQRAEALIPGTNEYRAALVLAVAGGPRQQVLRPAELESEDLSASLAKEALFGKNPVFTREDSTKTELVGHTLRITQDRSSLILDEQGSICIVQAASKQPDRTAIPALVEEYMLDQLQRALRFAGWILDQFDGPRRLTDIAPVAALLNAGYMPWRTQREQDRDPNSAIMSRGSERVLVQVSPPSRKRAALSNNSREIAEDFVVLLRRELRPG